VTLGRASGVLVPLFSLRSTMSWGVGEFPDLARFAKWLDLAGQSFVQLLPINEMPSAERSPYSAMTAMAVDPIFIAVPDVVDFEAIGGGEAFGEADRAELDAIRRDPTIAYGRVRAFKDRSMRRAWARFMRVEIAHSSPRAIRWQTFVREEAWWLEEYTFFRALHAEYHQRAWWDWPHSLARREDAALAAARIALQEEMAYWAYVQWIAAEQWREARRVAWPVKVFGDLPFMISGNSPDVWARQHEFRVDGTVGVPPDAFSDTGQDWGLPPWRWEVMQANGFEWMRHRARRAAALYDGYRLDHLVGMYRIYVRPHDAAVEAFFTPSEPEAQLRLGETLVTLFRDAGADLVAEDLGTVPDFVRESIARLGVPGFRVLRWERRWNDEGQPFIDPADYSEMSVATTGTHDTEALVEWWDELSAADRAAVLALPSVARNLGSLFDARSLVRGGTSTADASAIAFEPHVRDALLQAALDSGSRLVELPLQDIFGWRDRINTPATVADTNWGWSIPWPVNTLVDAREPLERAATLLTWTRAAGR
jgi:4-alpha-glucanotransferase